MKIIPFLCLLLAGSLFADDAGMKVGNFTFKGGDSWVKAPTSPMVKAAVTHGKEGPLLKFYHFGQGQGGGIDANLKRWKGQFQGEAKMTREDKTYGEQKVAIVTITGTYMVGPPFGEKVATKGQTLLGAVIPHPSGDVFLKMTGPEAEVTKSKDDFVKLIESALKK
ncbi:MAG: hypothetical protein ACON38_09155 [Akkermansiaceae bacterium]